METVSPGGCGRVSGSPHVLEQSRTDRLHGYRVGGKKKMHNLAWIAPLGRTHLSGVRRCLCAV